ncbi:MAG: flippase [Chloroflexi bacterium]|nr:flippase [Chloroflexota bacterium]
MSGPPQRRAAIHNFASLTVGHLVSKVTGLATLVVMARYLGDSEFGKFMIALVAVQLADTISDLGISQAIVRQGAGRPQRLAVDLAAVMPLKVVLAAVSVVVALAFVAASGGDAQLIEMTFYFAIAQALGSLTLLLRAVFQSFERMEYEAFSVALEGGIRLGAVVLAVAGSYGLVGIAKVLALASLVTSLSAGIVVLHRFTRPRLTIGWPHRAASLLLMGLPISFVWLAVGADQRINTLLLGRLATESAAGVFGAAFRLVEPTLIIPSMLIVALFPVAARHDREGLRGMQLLLTSSQKMLLALSLPIATAIWVAAPDVITIVFGTARPSVVQPVQILAPAVVLMFARLGLTQMLLAVGRWRAALVPQLLGILANILLALWLIPSEGASGAAWAVLGSEFAAVIAGMYALRADLGRPSITELARPVLVAAPAAAVGAALAPLSTAAAIIAAAAVYLFAMRVVRPFSAQDNSYLRAAMPLVAATLAFATEDR